MTDHVLLICGSRRRPSRTRSLVEVAAERADEIGLSPEILDLRERPMELFDGRDPSAYDESTQAAVEAFLDAERYVVASPVYFGGISGALKNLIDHVPYEQFTERPRTAGLVMTGRDRRHRQILDSQLRATLVYLGVSVPTRSVFATEDAFEEFTLDDTAVEDRTSALLEDIVSLHDGKA